VAVTELDTPRLRLRAWRDDDLEPFAAMNARPEVVRYLGGVPMTPAQSAAQLEQIVAHWAEHGFGLWAAEERATGSLAGFVGLSHPVFLPAVMPVVEVGWRLDPRVWGRGLATEGAAASLRYGAEVLGLRRIVSIIDPRNEASRRVAAKLGMALERSERHPADGRALDVWASRLD
jgi:RimJ/RimL family protein N-acetyltransferase